jgi:hypothetical protein
LYSLEVTGQPSADLLGTQVQHSPKFDDTDDAGNPIADGVTDGSRRVSGADVYRTVMTAAGIPASVIDGFPDARPGRVLSYMLK